MISRPNLSALQEMMRNLSKQQLIQYAQNPNPAIPNAQAVALMTLRERMDLEKQFPQPDEQGSQATVLNDALQRAATGIPAPAPAKNIPGSIPTPSSGGLGSLSTNQMPQSQQAPGFANGGILDWITPGSPYNDVRNRIPLTPDEVGNSFLMPPPYSAEAGAVPTNQNVYTNTWVPFIFGQRSSQPNSIGEAIGNMGNTMENNANRMYRDMMNSVHPSDSQDQISQFNLNPPPYNQEAPTTIPAPPYKLPPDAFNRLEGAEIGGADVPAASPIPVPNAGNPVAAPVKPIALPSYQAPVNGPSYIDAYNQAINNLQGNGQNNLAGLEANLAKYRADLAKRQAMNGWQALGEAGMAMAAGTSPYAMVNIGQGGLAGFKALRQGQKEMSDEERALLGVDANIAGIKTKYDADMKNTAVQLANGQISFADAQQKNAISKYTADIGMYRAQNEQAYRQAVLGADPDSVKTLKFLATGDSHKKELSPEEMQKAGQLYLAAKTTSSTKDTLNKIQSLRTNIEKDVQKYVDGSKQVPDYLMSVKNPTTNKDIQESLHGTKDERDWALSILRRSVMQESYSTDPYLSMLAQTGYGAAPKPTVAFTVKNGKAVRVGQ